MKEIKLQKSHRVVMVDDEDYEFLSQHKWYCSHERNNFYAVTHDEIDGYAIPVRMHRLLLGATGRTLVDHVDCNGLNNQRANLRLANFIENGQNRRPNKNRSYKGVSKITSNQYKAYIRVNGESIIIGYFKNPHDAALAYNEAAKKYFGKFARLNVIEYLPIYYKLMMI